MMFVTLMYTILLFSQQVTSLSLAGCVIWEYEKLRSHATSFLKRPGAWLNTHQKRFNAQAVSRLSTFVKLTI